MSFQPPRPPQPPQPQWPQQQQWPSQYGYPPGYATPTPKRSGWTPGAIIAVVGAALLVAGSLLDWVVVSSPFGEISRGGMDTDDGKLTVAAGGLGLLFFLIAASARTIAFHIIGAVTSLAGGAVALIDIIDVHDKAEDLGTEFASASVGIGLYVCVIGAIAGLVGGIIAAATSK